MVVVEVLGPCRLVGGPFGADGAASPSLSLTQRKILARLAVDAPAPVPVHAVEEAIWGAHPPPTSRPALQNQVSRLRARAGPDVVVTSGSGYSLGGVSDLALVTDELRAAEAALVAGDHDRASRTAERALGRWRGRALDELEDLPVAGAVRRQVGEVARALEAVRLEAAIGAGLLHWAVPEAERLVEADARDEHRWCLLVRALAGAGRRGDALAAVERARQVLAGTLGLGPRPELRAVEAEVLEVEAPAAGAILPIVGRAEELRVAVAELEEQRSVLVLGEAGGGRSVLLAEVVRQLRRRGRRVVTATCSPHAASALATVTELMDGLPSADERLDPVSRFAGAVVRAVAASGALVLAVDDVDCSGPTVRAALAAVAALDGVCLLLSAERGPGVVDGVVEVPLPPLARPQVSALAAGLLGADAPLVDDDLTWLHEMSGGNPLLLATLLDDPSVRARLAGAGWWPCTAPAHRVRTMRPGRARRDGYGDVRTWSVSRAASQRS